MASVLTQIVVMDVFVERFGPKSTSNLPVYVDPLLVAKGDPHSVYSGLINCLHCEMCAPAHYLNCGCTEGMFLPRIGLCLYQFLNFLS